MLAHIYLRIKQCLSRRILLKRWEKWGTGKEKRETGNRERKRETGERKGKSITGLCHIALQTLEWAVRFILPVLLRLPCD